MKYSDLLKGVRDILFQDWDPIGVNDQPLCQNEYDSYAPSICRLLREGANEDKLVNHLERLQKTSMGLSVTDAERDRKVASRLLSLLQSKVKR
jgi:hypothetical protein